MIRMPCCVRATLVIFAFLFGPPLFAQEVTLVHAGRLFDSERAVLLPRRDILIRDGMIEQVAERIEAPAGAQIVDLSAFTVLPGLVDAHTHLLMEHPGDQGPGETSVREVVREGDALRALRGAARAKTYLDAGFTTLRDLGNSGQFADIALRRAFAEGALPGPKLFVSGPGLSPPGGQLDGVLPDHQNIVAHEYRVIRGADDARAAVREAAVQGVDHIKVYANASPNPALLSIEEMTAIAQEAALMGLEVTAHASTDVAINRALDAGIRVIEHGRGASPVTLARMKREGGVMVLTEVGQDLLAVDLARLPVEHRPPQARLDAILAPAQARVAEVRRAGVEIAFGSDLYIDFGLPRGTAVLLALRAYVDGGMSPAEALRSATYVAGRLIEPGKIGTVSPGAYGDLVAIEGDPTQTLEALGTIRCVLLAGRVQSTPGSACEKP